MAAVVSPFASTLQAQLPVFATNGTKRNSNWLSVALNNKFYPTGSGNPFTRVMIGGDSIKTFTSGLNSLSFRPRVFIIRPGDSLTINGDVAINTPLRPTNTT